MNCVLKFLKAQVKDQISDKFQNPNDANLMNIDFVKKLTAKLKKKLLS